MKLMIASDLHGSYASAKKLLECFREERAEELILLGDIYYHGPRNPLPNEYGPMDVAALLNGMKDRLVVIRGNCDSEVDEAISEFPFLDARTVRYGNLSITLEHGHRYNDIHLPPVVGDVFLHGHTHMGYVKRQNGVVMGNPGSVSMPRGGTPASYLILTESALSLHALSDSALLAKELL